MANPGYPSPRDVIMVTSKGLRIPVELRFLDVILDAGVPTPRFVPTLQNMPQFKIDFVEVGLWPPGTIIAFEQFGDAFVNGVRIIDRSKKMADLRKIGFKRSEGQVN